MRAEVYHAKPWLSASRIKEFLRSPAHLRHMDENPKTGDALAFGDAFHTHLLEPMRFNEEFAVAPDVDRRTTAGKAQWQTFVDAHGHKKVLKHDDWLAITGMARSVMLNEVAGEMLAGRSDTEISMFWQHELGIPCKARIDAISVGDKCIIDLKSTTDASKEAFSRSVANFGYHIQAAWYIDAARAAGFEVETMVFIAVEKTAPYGTACYVLDEFSIDEGRRIIANMLPRYAACLHRNRWPSYDSMITTLKLPMWALRGEEFGL